MAGLREILALARAHRASDVHLTPGRVPALRIHGRLLPLDAPEWDGLDVDPALRAVLSAEDVQRLARENMVDAQWGELEARGETDYAFQLEELGRFRVNAFRQRTGPALAVRLLETEIPSLRRLGLPAIVAELARKAHGLILVTGPTGSGKSTTLAAVVGQINSERAGHIITLEDPIEYVHRHKRCFIHQREIGADSGSFAAALRAALRQDPDVILVGEMRDPETIGTAITAAETGHLVLATLHTSSAAETVDRIIDVFPPHQQQQVRTQLSTVLQGIVAQQLIPRADGRGRVLAAEVLVAAPAVRNLIREGKTHQIPAQLQTGARHGMQTLDTTLRHLFRAGLIGREEVLSRAADPAGVVGAP
ncbi:MAG: type IV pilus twitching motility protein PilT [Candidatus Desulforudis sp.]|nr:type IV pilus twitching motility protein PilT [Desulforudis sp.]